MTIQELLAQVRKAAAPDKKFSIAACSIAFQPALRSMISRGQAYDLGMDLLNDLQIQDAKIIEQLIEVIEEQHEALQIASNQLLGVSIAVREQGQNINPHFYITHYQMFSDKARAAIEATLQKLEKIK